MAMANVVPCKIAIAVHGGAGALSDAGVPAAIDGCSEAAKAGYAVLAAGGSALDAVEAATKVLEENTRFNAGRGSVLTRNGTVEMDALITDGGLHAGAVTLVRTTRHPITLARAVMERTPHIFLAGAAADALAVSCGLEQLPNEAFITPARREQLARTVELGLPPGLYSATPTAPGATTGAVSSSNDLRAWMPEAATVLDASTDAAAVRSAVAAAAAAAANTSETSAVTETPCAGDHDTVGAVALDAYGGLAAATSTGGMTGKWAGRVGDTPLLGAGGYADSHSGACSTTGTGEFIIRAGLARSVCDTYEQLAERSSRDCSGSNATATAAVGAALHRMQVRVGGPGAGLVFVSKDGEVGIGHTSARMSYAYATGLRIPQAQAATSVSSGDSSGGVGTAALMPIAFQFGAGVELTPSTAHPTVSCSVPPAQTVTEVLPMPSHT